MNRPPPPNWPLDFTWSLLRFAGFLLLFSKSRTIARFLPSAITSECVKNTRSKVVYDADPASQYHPIKPNALLDLLFGAVYLFHYPSPTIFMLVLLSFNPPGVLHFARVFSWACLLLGVVTQFIPLAPPWRVFPFVRDSNGLIVPTRHEAGFARFDERTNTHLFRKIYAGSPQLDGCMPSGHTLWPCVMWLCALQDDSLNAWPFFLHAVLVVCAAVFSQHHYLVDCAAAGALAAVSFWLVLT